MELENWKASGDRVIIKKIKDPDQVTPTGLFLAAKQDTVSRGEVVSVGQGALVSGSRVPIEVEIGDVVIYDDKYGTDIGSFHTSHSNEYMILHEQDILAIVGE